MNDTLREMRVEAEVHIVSAIATLQERDKIEASEINKQPIAHLENALRKLNEEQGEE